MNFVVDAHLPAALCTLLRNAGHDAVHTSSLPGGNSTPDDAIIELSMRELRIVITKDVDFYHSHILHQRPWKLLLVRTGNLRTRDLVAIFASNLPVIIAELSRNSLLELDRERVQVRDCD